MFKGMAVRIKGMNKKMSKWEFSEQFANLVLIASGDIEWSKEPRVRRAWHLFVVSMLVALGLALTFRLVFFDFHAEPTFVMVYRILNIIVHVFIILAITYMMQRFYSTLLLTGKDLRLKSIAFFYFVITGTFAVVYRGLYLLEPTSFSHPASLQTQ